MTIRVAANGAVQLEGICSVEDAESLLQILLASPGVSVDWRACEWAHTAVIQVLLAARIVPIGAPTALFMRDHLARVLEQGAA